ncbi:MAG: dihydropteroate synthase [Chloroflexi bacterium]|nr:dihydropteroate synthase [Chloroflexota bacterium]
MLLQLAAEMLDATHRTVVMGILNVGTDSPVRQSVVAQRDAVARGLALRDDGAAIVDVGAHSTRTGGREVSAQEEIERVCPVIAALRAEGVAVSVDTWTPAVARAAAEAGAQLLNDVSALRDPAMVEVAREHRLAVCVMHMRGDPKRHREADQRYADIGAEVRAFLLARAETLTAAGVPQVWLDPGFGFGKSAADNVWLLQALPALVAAGHPVLVSASRKGFLSELLGRGDRQDSPGLLEATLAFNVLAAARGAHVVRVHDVRAVADALRIADALRSGDSRDSSGFGAAPG